MKNLTETLTLAEKILLLHYDDETGARGDIGEAPADFVQALALATIFELVLEGGLHVEGSGKNTHIFAGDNEFFSSGKPVLNHIYHKILTQQQTKENKKIKAVDLRRWVDDQKILGESYEGMGIIHQRLLDEKIIKLRDMNRSLTKSSSLARMRGETIALSKKLAWSTRKAMGSWFGAVDSGGPWQERLQKMVGEKKSPANSEIGVWPRKSSAEAVLFHGSKRKVAGQKMAKQPDVRSPEPEEFRADFYVVQHPFPGEHGEIKLALRRRLNNALFSFVQLATVPQDCGVDRNIYKNTNSKVINIREAGSHMNGVIDFLDGVLELGGTMVPADIATIAAITRAAHIPNAFFPSNKNAKDDVLTAASEDLNARKSAFGLMGECARNYFTQEARQILSVAE